MKPTIYISWNHSASLYPSPEIYFGIKEPFFTLIFLLFFISPSFPSLIQNSQFGLSGDCFPVAVYRDLSSQVVQGPRDLIHKASVGLAVNYCSRVPRTINTCKSNYFVPCFVNKVPGHENKTVLRRWLWQVELLISLNHRLLSSLILLWILV